MKVLLLHEAIESPLTLPSLFPFCSPVTLVSLFLRIARIVEEELEGKRGVGSGCYVVSAITAQ